MWNDTSCSRAWWFGGDNQRGSCRLFEESASFFSPPFSQFVLIFHREPEQHDSNQETPQQRRWCNNFTACLLLLQPAPAAASTVLPLGESGREASKPAATFCQMLIFTGCHVAVISQAIVIKWQPWTSIMQCCRVWLCTPGRCHSQPVLNLAALPPLSRQTLLRASLLMLCTSGYFW